MNKMDILESNYRYSTQLQSLDGLSLERNGILRRVLDLFIVPILNHLPRRFEKLVQRSHKGAHKVIEHRTTHNALEILYKEGVTSSRSSLLERVFRNIWFYRNNPKGVRNRLKIVTAELSKIIKECLKRNQARINILSIASGSARAVVEALQSCTSGERARISCTFLDKNPRAHEYSRQLIAEELGEKSLDVRWIETTANSFPDHFNEPIDIIEMVGLLDYFDDKQTEKTFKTIHEHLNTDGYLITANIMPNSEQGFVTRVIGWDMIYRTPEQFAKILEDAGFSSNKMRIYVEPMRIHCIIIAQK